MQPFEFANKYSAKILAHNKQQLLRKGTQGLKQGVDTSIKNFKKFAQFVADKVGKDAQIFSEQVCAELEAIQEKCGVKRSEVQRLKELI